ncbi:MAG: flagellar basal body L-ring protein FlgH [Synergistaceae bacterium]|jgi:flagellar L-ring protein precursor FlgH|nr:flagellar basal body L-ring protein FlgH [Synergistaceae bacterium]
MKMLKTGKLAVFLAALVIVATALPLFASSLWDNNGSLFADRKASGVGDVIMVRVNEDIDDSDEGQTSSSKTTDENVNSGFGILDFIRAFGFGSSSAMSSNTTIERTKTIDARFSCLVVDVMPNGNMVIQGDRLLTSAGEKMNVRFSGVVRPQDVTHDNTVESIRVANAEIVVAGKGTISASQRPGIISQIMKMIF